MKQKLTFKQLCQKLTEEKEIYISNIEITGDIDFSQLSITNNAEEKQSTEAKNIIDFDVCFVNCTFKGKIFTSTSETASKCEFTRDVEFSSCEFGKSFSIKETKFKNKLTINTSTFLDKFEFFNSETLHSALFLENSFFSDVKVIGNSFLFWTDFTSSTFKEESEFISNSFFNHTTFHKTIFEERAKFVKNSFFRNIFFKNSKFLGETQFTQVKFSNYVDFRKCNFSDDTIFSRCVFKYANFKKASFLGDITFGYCKVVKKIDLTETIFQKEIGITNTSIRYLKGIQAQETDLSGSVIETANFGDLDKLEKFNFKDAFLISVSLDGKQISDCNFTGAVLNMISARHCILDEQTVSNTKYIYSDYRKEKTLDEDKEEYEVFTPDYESRIPADGFFGDENNKDFTLKEYLYEPYKMNFSISIPSFFERLSIIT